MDSQRSREARALALGKNARARNTKSIAASSTVYLWPTHRDWRSREPHLIFSKGWRNCAGHRRRENGVAAPPPGRSRGALFCAPRKKERGYGVLGLWRTA